MTVRHSLLRLTALVLAIIALPVGAVVLTGNVVADGAQPIYTPPSMSSPVVLQYYVEDGIEVEPGDVLLRIDAGQAASQLRNLRNKIEQAEARAEKEVAELKLKQLDAQLALVDAIAARDTAKVDAGIPQKLISQLDHDRYQGEYERTQRDARLKQEQLAAAKAAVTRRIEDGALEVEKLKLQLGFFQAQVDTATVTATQPGVVVHAFEGRLGDGRYEQGSSSFPGNQVGQVVGPGARSVEAWALAPDRRGLSVGQQVRLSFDALQGIHAIGTISAISGASQSKAEWGEGRYYVIDIELSAGGAELPLLPGMSVRVDTELEAMAHADTAPASGALMAAGEVYARKSLAVMPPQIDGLWRLNVTSMADDGAKVSKGETIVVFAGGNLAQELPTKMSELAEKKRALEKLELELADRARDSMLETAKIRAEVEKAQRKATQPKEYVPGIEYQKLLIDRARTEQRLRLMIEREQVDAAARAAARRLAESEVAQLQREVAEMQASLAKLTVRAPGDGVFLHRTMWNGDKIEVGSSVFRGMSVGEIPDMDTLAVLASLPERELQRVHVGQAVRVVLTGGASRTVNGSIAKIGRSVHSKSRVEPIPVVDLDIELEVDDVEMKPGQPVRVKILESGKAEARKLEADKLEADKLESGKLESGKVAAQ